MKKKILASAVALAFSCGGVALANTTDTDQDTTAGSNTSTSTSTSASQMLLAFAAHVDFCVDKYCAAHTHCHVQPGQRHRYHGSSNLQR